MIKGDLFPSLKDLPWLSIDLETFDPKIKERGGGWPRLDGYIAGVAITSPAGGHYYPVRHQTGENMDGRKVFAWLRKELSTFEGEVYGANFMYDMGWLLAERKIDMPKVKRLLDPQWVEAILDEDRQSYSLQALTEYHGLEGKATDDLDRYLIDRGFIIKEGKGKGQPDRGKIAFLSPEEVGPYAIRDCDAVVDVLAKQRLHPEFDELGQIISLEHRLMPRLVGMRLHGVRVDLEYAQDLEGKLQAQEKTHLGEMTGHGAPAPDIWSTEEVAKYCEALSIEFPRLKTGSPSFTKDWLTSHDHPAMRALGQARKFNRAHSKFVTSDILDGHHRGRVHPELHPLRADRDDDGNKVGTAGGRFACINPNLQQIPSPDRDPELGPLMRRLYLPDEGEYWASCDWSQQEPRLIVHFAELMNIPGAKMVGDRFREDPDLDYHTEVGEITKLPRKQAKFVNLGIPYGMGGGKLCKVYLKMPTKMWKTPSGNWVEVAGDEGRAVLRQYHNKLPHVKGLMDDVTAVAGRRGWIKTLLGRRRRFQLYQPGNDFNAKPLRREEAEVEWPGRNLRRAFTHKALNSLIQGSAADMVKKSMLDLWDNGFNILITVHDENCLSVNSMEEAKRAAEIMNDCVKLTVPLKVDIGFGRSWGDAKED